MPNLPVLVVGGVVLDQINFERKIAWCQRLLKSSSVQWWEFRAGILPLPRFDKEWGPAGRWLRLRRGSRLLRSWLFFNIRIAIPHPSRLSLLVRTCQDLPGTLDGEVQFVKNTGDMGRMVGNREFFLNNSGDHRAGPNAGIESIGNWAAVQDVPQSLQLLIGEFLGATRAVPLKNSFHAPLLPMVQPKRDFGPMHFEETGNFRGGSSFHIEHHRMQSSRHPVGPFLGSLFAQSDESFNRAFGSMNLFRVHGIALPVP